MDKLSRKLDRLELEVDDLSLKLSSRLVINSKIVKAFRQTGLAIIEKQKEIEKNIGSIKKKHAVLEKDHAILEKGQATLDNGYAFLKGQRNIDIETVSSEISVIKNRITELDDIANKLDQQDIENKNVNSTLRVIENGLIELDAYIANKLDQQDIENKNVNSTLGVIKNRLIELEEYIAHKLEQKFAMDSSAAAEFHSFAYEKYKLLETASDKQRDLLAQIAADQKELAARNISLLSDQVDLGSRIVRVEDEQMECSCSELRMMIARSAADRKKLEKERSELLNEHEKLQRKVAEEEAARREGEQRAVISEPLESREENVAAVITALASALNIDLHLEDIVEEPEAKSTCPVSSERLAKALVSEMRAKTENSLPETGPYYMHCVIAVVALIINLLGLTMFYIIFH